MKKKDIKKRRIKIFKNSPGTFDILFIAEFFLVYILFLDYGLRGFILGVLISIIFSIIALFIYDSFLSSKQTSSFGDEDNSLVKDKFYHDLDGTIKKYFPNYGSEKELLDELYKRFIQVEKSVCSGDFETLKLLCTDSLYNLLFDRYYDGYNNNEERVMDNFTLFTYNINNLEVDNNLISIKIYLHISYNEYFVDSDGSFIYSNTKEPIHQHYLLDFVIDREKTTVCPNCGSNISSKKCGYCGTVLKDKYLDFTLSKIGFIENMN